MTTSGQEFARLLDEGEQFYWFINRAFNEVAGSATTEELATWAFGDLETARETYRKFRKNS